MDVDTIRSKEVVCHEGFQYIFDKMGADQVTKYFRCRRRDINCKGRIHIKEGLIFVKNNHGGHEESPVDIEVSNNIINN